LLFLVPEIDLDKIERSGSLDIWLLDMLVNLDFHRMVVSSPAVTQMEMSGAGTGKLAGLSSM
jgi:hypothetical protein